MVSYLVRHFSVWVFSHFLIRLRFCITVKETTEAICPLAVYICFTFLLRFILRYIIPLDVIINEISRKMALSRKERGQKHFLFWTSLLILKWDCPLTMRAGSHGIFYLVGLSSSSSIESRGLRMAQTPQGFYCNISGHTMSVYITAYVNLDHLAKVSDGWNSPRKLHYIIM